MEFVVRVTDSLGLQQQSPQQCPSTRFGRRFGSASFVKLTFSREALEKLRRQQGGLLSYAQRPIVTVGRVFRAYSSRDSNIFYVQTNEVAADTEKMRQCILKDPSPSPLSFLDFIKWHNPLEYNQNQVIFICGSLYFHTDADSSQCPSGPAGSNLGSLPPFQVSSSVPTMFIILKMKVS